MTNTQINDTVKASVSTPLKPAIGSTQPPGAEPCDPRHPPAGVALFCLQSRILLQYMTVTHDTDNRPVKTAKYTQLSPSGSYPHRAGRALALPERPCCTCDMDDVIAPADNRIIALTEQPAITAEIMRVSAAAGVPVAQVNHDSVLRWWRSAALVMVDVASAGHLTDAGLPPHAAVVALATAPPSSDQWQACLALGVRQVIDMSEDQKSEELVRLVAAAAASRQTETRGSIIAVMGARGGAGASILAATTAWWAARSSPAVLIDLDPWSYGQETLLGLEQRAGATWADVATAGGRVAVEPLRAALPHIADRGADLSVLGFGAQPRDNSADSVPGGSADTSATQHIPVETVVTSISEAGLVTVIDTPRVPDRATRWVLAHADLTVVVAPADVISCFAAARLMSRLVRSGARAQLVVRGPSPGGLGGDDMAAALDLPLLATMRPQPRIDRAIDAGQLLRFVRRGPLPRVAAAIVAQVAGT